MWLFLREGFFAVKAYDPERGGENVDEPHLIVRARVRSDLERLRQKYSLEEDVIDHEELADYRYHLRISNRRWADILHAEAEGLDYGNFKAARPERYDTYLLVWSILKEELSRLDDQEEKARYEDSL